MRLLATAGGEGRNGAGKSGERAVRIHRKGSAHISHAARCRSDETKPHEKRNYTVTWRVSAIRWPAARSTLSRKGDRSRVFRLSSRSEEAVLQ